MHSIAPTLLAVMASAITTSVSAAENPEPAPVAARQGCTAAPSRQFDFWLGQWEVTDPTGKPAGRSRIESILDGCVLLENWDSPAGVSGKSFNIFNADIGR